MKQKIRRAYIMATTFALLDTIHPTFLEEKTNMIPRPLWSPPLTPAGLVSPLHPINIKLQAIPQWRDPRYCHTLLRRPAIKRDFLVLKNPIDHVAELLLIKAHFDVCTYTKDNTSVGNRDPLKTLTFLSFHIDHIIANGSSLQSTISHMEKEDVHSLIMP